MNPKPQRWRLPPSDQALLRSAMSDGATDKKSVTSEQRSILRQICSAPERRTFEPEDLLIAFKLALVDAANDVGITPGPDRNDFLSRLVTAYIEEFYRYPIIGDGAGKAGDQDLAVGGP
jgi:hypothetical protein